MYEETDGSKMSAPTEANGSERKQDTDSSNLRSRGMIQIKLEKRTPEEKQAYLEGYEAGKKKSKKSLTEIAEEMLEDIKAEICDTRCKWPEKWDKGQGELCESEHCANCPLNRL